jgi:ABC-type Fe3+/spermidine/putrescine transport system ATPase subunit
LLQVGSASELYRQPRNLFVAGFVGSANLVPGTVKARDGGNYLVDSPVGPVTAGAWESVASGTRTVLVIRPEDIDVADADHANRDSRWVTGRLLSASGGGSITHLTVEVHGTTLAVEHPGSPSARLTARPGDSVAVRCNRETAWLVPPDAGGAWPDQETQQEPGARERTVIACE